jgi:hypothetical protein
MRGPTFKVVDDSERTVQYPHKVHNPNRWDKIAPLVAANKTVFIATKHRPNIMTALANRGIKSLHIFARPGGFIVFKKEENE